MPNKTEIVNTIIENLNLTGYGFISIDNSVRGISLVNNFMKEVASDAEFMVSVKGEAKYV